MLFLIWSVVLIVALILYYKKTYSAFSKYGVKNMTPIPLLGNGFSVLIGREHIVDNSMRIYQQYPEERFFGQYEFLRPLVIVKDIELIKQITIKDFEYFLDHKTMVDGSIDPLFGRNLFSLKGEEWKDMRSTLSPAFTSSKMKMMLPFIVEVGNRMTDTLKKQIKESNEKYLDIEGKDLTTRYANDVIASCAFGLKVDSFAEENNEFLRMGKVITNFGLSAFLKFFMFLYLPVLTKMLNIKLFSDTTANFYKNLFMNTMNDRITNNIVRPDMIHLLMQAKKGKLVQEEKPSKEADAGFATVDESNIGTKTVNKDWSNIDLIAQAVLFFLAGFETVSTAMTFALYQMAATPEIQEKLIQEIKENDIKNGGKFDFHSIQNMTYMDMVISEVLRLWSPAIALDRICTKDYNLGRANDKAPKDYIMRKGDCLQIPNWAIHRDPKYFPNPTKFDPERFSEENKHNIQPFSYMPFGLGPRNCIASRFALCEVKVMLYQILQHFEVEACERTCIPPEFIPGQFNLNLKGGTWIRLRIRQ
ncbi:unnamed protein product [Chilo suppressalis]|uniref:unspecific monooxygenase n=1 Tax=Chilo suppressalis TaxID=168631 RepID=A0ABN8E9N1_CHISP|nr:unnamed protein product [Chilo suppressalis]